MIENSRPLTKIPVTTASLFLLHLYRLHPKLFFAENTDLMTTKTHSLKNNDKVSQYTVDKLSPQDYLLCLSLRRFYPAFDKDHENSHVFLNKTQYTFNQYPYIPLLQK